MLLHPRTNQGRDALIGPKFATGCKISIGLCGGVGHGPLKTDPVTEHISLTNGWWMGMSFLTDETQITALNLNYSTFKTHSKRRISASHLFYFCLFKFNINFRESNQWLNIGTRQDIFTRFFCVFCCLLVLPSSRSAPMLVEYEKNPQKARVLHPRLMPRLPFGRSFYDVTFAVYNSHLAGRSAPFGSSYSS